MQLMKMVRFLQILLVQGFLFLLINSDGMKHLFSRKPNFDRFKESRFNFMDGQWNRSYQPKFNFNIFGFLDMLECLLDNKVIV